jgi:hypothetical protein
LAKHRRPPRHLAPGARPGSGRGAKAALALGIGLLAGGGVTLGIASTLQRHAPAPTSAQAGTLRPPAPASSPLPAKSVARPSAGSLWGLATALRSRWPLSTGPALPRSRPVSIEIPAIGVHAPVVEVGRNPNGTIQVPPLFAQPSPAAWYRYSPTPGQVGPSVIVGHVDNVYGPAVFFRLGELVPGDKVKVVLADGEVAVFVVDGVRSYPKSNFPTATVYGPTDFPALRLITCGGPFDSSTRQYLDNTVVFASLEGSSQHVWPATSASQTRALRQSLQTAQRARAGVLYSKT